MPFAALLTKELRSRLRRERTVWIIIVYVLLMSLLGWIIVGHWTNGTGAYYNNNFGDAGTTLYYFLSISASSTSSPSVFQRRAGYRG